jgi:hypothetical protein
MSGKVLVWHSGASHLCQAFMRCHTYSWRDFDTLLHRTRGILDIKFLRIILVPSTISDNLWVLFVPTPNKCLTWVRWTKVVTDVVSFLTILNVVSPAIPESLSVLFFYTMYIYLAAVWDLGSHCVTCLQCSGRLWSLPTVGIWCIGYIVFCIWMVLRLDFSCFAGYAGRFYVLP